MIGASRAEVDSMGCRWFAGFPLDKTAALMAHADAVIGNDSGPVHLAAAVGTPVVDLYALTNMQHTPWQVPSRVLYALPGDTTTPEGPGHG